MTFVSFFPSRNHRTLAYGLTATLAVVIAVLTLIPQALPTQGSGEMDKLYHFLAFAGLMLPVAALRPRALVWMIPAALLFGGGIEIIQPFVNRGRELADFLADGVGILTGSAVGLALHWFQARHVR